MQAAGSRSCNWRFCQSLFVWAAIICFRVKFLAAAESKLKLEGQAVSVGGWEYATQIEHKTQATPRTLQMLYPLIFLSSPNRRPLRLPLPKP